MLPSLNKALFVYLFILAALVVVKLSNILAGGNYELDVS